MIKSSIFNVAGFDVAGARAHRPAPPPVIHRTASRVSQAATIIGMAMTAPKTTAMLRTNA